MLAAVNFAVFEVDAGPSTLFEHDLPERADLMKHPIPLTGAHAEPDALAGVVTTAAVTINVLSRRTRGRLSVCVLRGTTRETTNHRWM